MTQVNIDLSALQRLKAIIGGDTKDLAELVDDYVTTLPVQLTDMKEQLASRDWVGLRITAHSCKSNANDMGAAELAELCGVLENQCKNENLFDPEGQVAEISNLALPVLETLTTLDFNNV